MILKDFPLGTCVTYSTCYDTGVSNRFDGRKGDAVPREIVGTNKGEGMVIGHRQVIMTGLRYSKPDYGGGDYESGFSTGKQEVVLLVTNHPRSGGVLVRPADATIRPEHDDSKISV